MLKSLVFQSVSISIFCLKHMMVIMMSFIVIEPEHTEDRTHTGVPLMGQISESVRWKNCEWLK